MPRTPTSAEIEWVIAAKSHAVAYPQPDASVELLDAWQDRRRSLEKTAPGVQVTAAQVAAYEATKGSTV